MVGLSLALACAKKDSPDASGRDLQLAPTDSTHALGDRPQTSASRRAASSGSTRHESATPSPTSPHATERTLAAGTAVAASLEDSINSRSMKAGRSVTARVSRDVKDAAGHVVIPAGSTVHLSVTALSPATSRSQSDGKLSLRAEDVVVHGATHAVSADVGPVPHELHGRGVTAGEAEKVGVGTAVGALAGRIIGGNAKGAVIGGAVGAAGGTAVAVQTASRDVVVRPGAPITLTLTGPFTIKP